MKRTIVLALIVCFAAVSTLNAEVRVRVATYNIKFLKATVEPERLQKLRSVVEELDADVIGLQEINDRAALELLFPAAEYGIIIDDQSGDDQDVALVFRRAVVDVATQDGDADADDEDFLFPTTTANPAFPNRRDVLNLRVQVKGTHASFQAMVIHAKARFGGRATTEPRRVSAAQMLLERLEQDFDGTKFLIVGDFNDTPDDRSLNILETGNPDAGAEMEERQGEFLINLGEHLWAANLVTHGLNSHDIQQGIVVTTRPGQRQQDYDLRTTDLNTGAVMFDQILISHAMNPAFVQGSVRVFAPVDAVKGNSQNRASDHVPVLADFMFGTDDDQPTPSPLIAIVGALPDPVGPDRNNESVLLKNTGNASVSISGWTLADRSGHTYLLEGEITPGETTTITLQNTAFSLNNAGDDVVLTNPQQAVVHRVTYGTPVVSPGVIIRFE